MGAKSAHYAADGEWDGAKRGVAWPRTAYDPDLRWAPECHAEATGVCPPPGPGFLRGRCFARRQPDDHRLATAPHLTGLRDLRGRDAADRPCGGERAGPRDRAHR